ncbi:hypothetical protein N0V90_007029 [Kalmusia sp. IMI 367209]|nr:hypothetical protein N0V90_007029 [Kalmusia sp. IMI 367209]
MKLLSVALTLLLTTLTSASPLMQNHTRTNPTVKRGESHTNVRFSPIAAYPLESIDTYGACSTYGQEERFHMRDPSSMMVALDASVENFSSYCGKKIRLRNPDGRTCEATIVDQCPGCRAAGGPWSLDLLQGPWDEVGSGDYHVNVFGAGWEVI